MSSDIEGETLGPIPKVHDGKPPYAGGSTEVQPLVPDSSSFLHKNFCYDFSQTICLAVIWSWWLGHIGPHLEFMEGGSTSPGEKATFLYPRRTSRAPTSVWGPSPLTRFLFWAIMACIHSSSFFRGYLITQHSAFFVLLWTFSHQEKANIGYCWDFVRSTPNASAADHERVCLGSLPEHGDLHWTLMKGLEEEEHSELPKS